MEESNIIVNAYFRKLRRELIHTVELIDDNRGEEAKKFLGEIISDIEDDIDYKKVEE